MRQLKLELPVQVHGIPGEQTKTILERHSEWFFTQLSTELDQALCHPLFYRAPDH